MVATTSQKRGLLMCAVAAAACGCGQWLGGHTQVAALLPLPMPWLALPSLVVVKPVCHHCRAHRSSSSSSAQQGWWPTPPAAPTSKLLAVLGWGALWQPPFALCPPPLRHWGELHHRSTSPSQSPLGATKGQRNVANTTMQGLCKSG